MLTWVTCSEIGSANTPSSEGPCHWKPQFPTVVVIELVGSSARVSSADDNGCPTLGGAHAVAHDRQRTRRKGRHLKHALRRKNSTGRKDAADKRTIGPFQIIVFARSMTCRYKIRRACLGGRAYLRELEARGGANVEGHPASRNTLGVIRYADTCVLGSLSLLARLLVRDDVIDGEVELDIPLLHRRGAVRWEVQQCCMPWPSA